jgi:hypothetical protein
LFGWLGWASNSAIRSEVTEMGPNIRLHLLCSWSPRWPVTDKWNGGVSSKFWKWKFQFEVGILWTNGCAEGSLNCRIAEMTQGTEARHCWWGLVLFVLRSLVAMECIQGSGANSAASEN